FADGQASDLQSRMEHLDPGFDAVELAAGSFVLDEAPLTDLAALAADGAVHILRRNAPTASLFKNDASQLAGLTPHESRVEIRKRYIEDVKASAADPAWQPGGQNGWREVGQLDARIAPPAPGAHPSLVPSNISSRRADDLLLLDDSNRQVQVVVNTSW